jgi:hypothetical protein
VNFEGRVKMTTRIRFKCESKVINYNSDLEKRREGKYLRRGIGRWGKFGSVAQWFSRGGKNWFTYSRLDHTEFSRRLEELKTTWRPIVPCWHEIVGSRLLRSRHEKKVERLIFESTESD